jgi:hypothetical protein
MNDNGWIKIRKSIYNHWLWQDAEYLKWWIDLLLMANWEDDEKLVGKQLVTLKRGQLIASMSFLMNRWDRSRKMIEHFLNLLQEKEMITKEVKHNISIITITNYDKHQGNDKDVSREQKKANKGTSKGAYLESNLTAEKSNTCDNADTTRGAYLGATESSHQGAHLGTHLGAYQGATIKEYKEYKEKDIVVADAHTHTHARMDALDLRPYQARLEAMAMSCRLKPKELDNLIKEFNLHLESVGETHDDANKYLQHLYNWINKLKEKRNANNHSTPNNQPDFAQRISGAATVALGFLRDGNAGSPQTKSSGSGVPAKVLPF